MSVLVLADHDQGRLSPSTARLVAAADRLGPVGLLVVGEAVGGVAEAASALDGIQHVLVADDPVLATQAPEPLAELLARLAEGRSHIVAGAGSVGRDVIPRLAARLDVMPVTDVTAVLGPNRYERPIYAGNVIETVSSSEPVQLLTVRASAFRPAAIGEAAAPIEAVPATGLSAPASLVATHRTEGDRPDLATARIVVGGGVSVGSTDGFRLIERLAERLGAAVGATRAAVDAGYAPNDFQVGQTGKTIAPDLYLAFGISGALQHLAGIGGTKTIAAVNTDSEAPLMKLADLRLTGDLFSVIPELIAELDRLGVAPPGQGK